MSANLPNRRAFTLIELILVIVILGIVSSIGMELIARVYKNYLLQRAQHNASIKTELAALQIANRLTYAIPGTVIRRVGKSGAPELITEAMIQDPSGDSYTVLQWVANDADSFNSIKNNSNRKPGWSGFCDLNASTLSGGSITLSTPGSYLERTDVIIKNLSRGSGSPHRTITDAVIYFPDDFTPYSISSASGESITMTVPSGLTHPAISEHYKLSWSSYALVVEGGDLYLYYNFSPSPGANIGNTHSLLLKNVSTFKFKGAGRTIRFKICKEENIGEDYNITSCKEKAVF